MPENPTVGDGGDAVTLDDFRRYRDTGSRRLRNQLVEAHLDLVNFYVRRYKRAGVSEDDLRQQAFVALIGAVERYDPDRGVSFKVFANRTVEGELKRHLRDRGWAIRPPRSLQELNLLVRRTEAAMTHELGRHPTVAEVAERLEESRDRVVEAMSAGGTYHLDSIDAPERDDRGGGSDVPVAAEGFADIERQNLVDSLLAEADPRDREILVLRFYEELSQTEIADRLGVSQSYLSRVLRQALERMRDRLEAADEP